MRSYRKELWFDVPGRRAFINITAQVEQCVTESGICEGLALVNAMHITASVFINDDEKGLQAAKIYDNCDPSCFCARRSAQAASATPV